MAAIILSAFSPALSIAAPTTAPTVTLTSRDGKTLEATIVSISASAVKVRRRDGKEFEIPLDRLTDESSSAAKAAAPKPKPAKVPEKPKHPDDIPDKVIVKIGSKSATVLTVTDGKLHAPRTLNGDPEKTPCFTVDSSTDGKMVFATVKQTILPAIKLRCLARLKGKKEYFPTSLLPLQKGLPCFESWGDDIEELVFFGWEETVP